MKKRWIDKYSSEFDENRNINVVRESTELLNVKPKSIWFVRHVLSEGIHNGAASDSLEDGEICSEGGREQDEPIVKNYEATDEIWSDDDGDFSTPLVKHHWATDESWSVDDGVLDKTTGKRFEQIEKIDQVSPVCDLVNTVVEVKGNFRKVYDYRDPITNSNGPVPDTVNTVVQIRGNFRKVYDYNGPVPLNACNDPVDNVNTVKVNGPFRNVFDYRGRGQRFRKDFNDYGKNERRPNGYVS